MQYGYRYGEVPLPKCPEVKIGTKFGRYLPWSPLKRSAVAASLGCHVVGAALPHPDPDDPLTLEAGVRKRFAFRPPEPKPGILEALRGFVRKFARKHLVPLAPDSDTTTATWLGSTPYPMWRREELMKKMEKCLTLEEHHMRCKSFMKDECYPEWKHARAINSRTDEFKCTVGPIFKLIEKEVFQLPWFIKKVPIHDRPKYILERLYVPGSKYMATDYTAFESLFTADLMKACEFELYDYMTSKLPQHEEFMRLVREVLAGKNTCDFKFFTVQVLATRMSGEMCTSLGNGWSNLMFMLFLTERKGGRAIGVVEGDDGLFRVDGPAPTSEDFKDLGLVIKLEMHDELESASFCGLIFDREDLVNVANPLDELVSFGWCQSRYAQSSPKVKLMLLRCKALSLAHQYPGCPILSSLAQYGLRVTRSVRFYMRGFMERQGSHLSSWVREQYLSAISDEAKVRVVPPPMRTRLLVERQFGVTVAMQLAIEHHLDNLHELKPLNLSMEWPAPWVDNWTYYVGQDQGSFPQLTKTRLPFEVLFRQLRSGT